MDEDNNKPPQSADRHSALDEEYDVIVCGTGLKECILSGLLSVSGKKVLHLDRNDYYGAESASLTLTSLFEKFCPGQTPPAEYGSDCHWSVDLIPKFVMAAGSLVLMLLKTKVAKYLDWKPVDGTYVYQHQEDGWVYSAQFIHKVPASGSEAAASPLMGTLEKLRCKSFFQYASAWKQDDAETHQGLDPKESTMAQVYEQFGLCENTQDFIGHAVALYTNDNYLPQPCGPTLHRIQLYMASIQQYGGSPFLYPIYGLGGIPEGFARLSSLHNGLYKLRAPVEGFEYDPNGKVCGVRSEGQTVKCKMVICDPSYAPASKQKACGKIIRAICILGAPIPETGESKSCQVIIPQRQLNRQNDVFVSLISWAHCVASKGKYIAIVSTTVESDAPEEEIEPALKLLGEIEHKFINVSDLFTPTDDGTKDQVFVTETYDATSNFESATDEVLRMWKTITGEELDLTIPPAGPEDEEQ